MLSAERRESGESSQTDRESPNTHFSHTHTASSLQVLGATSIAETETKKRRVVADDASVLADWVNQESAELLVEAGNSSREALLRVLHRMGISLPYEELQV